MLDKFTKYSFITRRFKQPNSLAIFNVAETHVNDHRISNQNGRLVMVDCMVTAPDIQDRENVVIVV